MQVKALTVSHWSQEITEDTFIKDEHDSSGVATGGGGGGVKVGQSAPHSEKFAKKRGKGGKYGEKEWKNQEKEEKSGRKGKNQEGSFTLPSWQIGLVSLHFCVILIQ